MSRARALLGAVVLVGLLVALPARADAPQAQGWWTSLHRAGAPAPPVPPDVAADDLLLQGGDAVRELPDTGVLDRTPAPTALGALRFSVPAGSTVGVLVLQVAAGAQAADVRAYPTTSAWVPAQGGAVEDAPVPDLSRYSPGLLSPDGTTLSFRDIGRLVAETGALDVVLVPGPLDRVVVHHPGPQALTVTGSGVVVTGCRCPFEPDPSSSPPPPSALSPALSPALPPALPAVLSGPPAPVAAPPAVPAVAPLPATAGSLSSATRATRREVADDGRTRVMLALEAALVLALFGLLGQGPLAVLARLTGQPGPAGAVRGVGRFAREREGSPPPL